MARLGWLGLLGLSGCFIEVHGTAYYAGGGGSAAHFAPEVGVSLGVLCDTPVPRAVAAGNVTIRSEQLQGKPGKLVGYPLLLRMDLGPESRSPNRPRISFGGSGSQAAFYGDGRFERLSQLELFLGGSFTRFLGEAELTATLQASGVYSTAHKEFLDSRPTAFPDLYAVGPQVGLAFGIPLGPEGMGAITNQLVDTVDRTNHAPPRDKLEHVDDDLAKMQEEQRRRERQEAYQRCLDSNLNTPCAEPK